MALNPDLTINTVTKQDMLPVNKTFEEVSTDVIAVCLDTVEYKYKRKNEEKVYNY